MRNLFNVFLFSAMLTLLAAAAVPNFLEAQYHQRMARVKADLPALAAALEAYKIDHGKYPYDGADRFYGPDGFKYWYTPWHMTTPTPYISNSRKDPFKDDLVYYPLYQYNHYRYINIRSTWGTDYYNLIPSTYLDEVLAYWGEYRIVSVGPDGYYGSLTTGWYSEIIDYPYFISPYDPTNGIISEGDIERTQKFPPYLQNN